MFSAALLDHFQNPRNVGDLPEANVKVKVSNPVCGDLLQLAALIHDDVIRDIRFLCRGCTASIASASLLTESVKGRKLSEVSSITPESLAASIGEMPAASFHAVQLAHDALEALLRAARK
jgi:nitrogen fixation protein NifU and related proteins